jgi:hypothetical protein
MWQRVMVVGNVLAPLAMPRSINAERLRGVLIKALGGSDE